MLEVGYQGGEELISIFKGTIQWISDTKESQDRITELHCKDGGVELSTANTSRSFPKNSSYKSVIDQLVNDLGLPVGTVIVDDNRKIPSPISIVGNTGRNLKAVANSIDHNFSVQDGTAVVMPSYKRTSQVVAYISEESGLIGSPAPFRNELKPGTAVKKTSSTESKKKKKPAEGVKFKCQINGAILPEYPVHVKSKNYDETFKVVSLTHTGDYEGSDWHTECEVVSLSATTDMLDSDDIDKGD